MSASTSFTHALGSLLYCFFSSRRRHTRWTGDWSSDVCSSDLCELPPPQSHVDEHGQCNERNGDRQRLPGNESWDGLGAVAIENEGSPVARMAQLCPGMKEFQFGQAQR